MKGLAEYAAKHWAAFGRIEASFVEKEAVRRLDVRVERKVVGQSVLRPRRINCGDWSA